MRFVVWVVVNAGAVALAAWLFNGITVTASTPGHRLLTLIAVGVIFGIISSFLKPVLTVLSIPLIILSLGFFLLVLNALMLMLTSKIAGGLGLGFHVDGFWTAVFGAIVISLASMLLEALLPDPDRQPR